MKGLNLDDHLISLWISTLKSAPPMHIEWVLQLLCERFHLHLGGMSTGDRKQQSLTPREMDLFYFIYLFIFQHLSEKVCRLK